jgi:hypothetical protein
MGMLKTNGPPFRMGQGGVPCLRRASFAEVATEAESATRLRAEALQRASAQAGHPFAVLTY